MSIDRKTEGPIRVAVVATLTLPRGHAAKVLCLANSNGGVRDVTLDKR